MSYGSYSEVIFSFNVCLRNSNCCVGVTAELIRPFTFLICGNAFDSLTLHHIFQLYADLI